MDKYDLVLDLIEHPAKYSTRRIEEILSDPEAKEIYMLLCKTESSFAATKDNINVEDEWLKFSDRNNKYTPGSKRRITRAASIAAIALSSLAALAISATFAIKSFEDKKLPLETQTEQSAIEASVNVDSIDVTVTEMSAAEPVVFKDNSLDYILRRIAQDHNVELEFKHPEAAQLRMYYRYDPSMPLEETIEQLNNFEQINIRLSGNKITAD